MKRIARPLAAIVAIGLAAACSGPEKKAADGLDAVKAAGKIVLGTSADFPPYEFHMEEGGQDTIVGFDIEVAKQIAADLGVTLEIKDMNFDGLLAALDSGSIDIVVAGMNPTEERKKAVDFTDVYYMAEQTVIVRAADAVTYVSVESLKDAMIGAQKGATQVGIAKKKIKGLADEAQPSDQVKELPKLGDLVLALKNGNIDAVVVESAVAAAYVRANPDLALAPFTFPDEDGGSAIAVKKGNPALLSALNATLGRLSASGAVEEYVAGANALMDRL